VGKSIKTSVLKPSRTKTIFFISNVFVSISHIFYISE